MDLDVSRDHVDAVVAEMLGDLDHPMPIVTVASGDEQAGCLVGFASQCSINPPLLTVWLSERNRTLRVALGASALAVHFPASDQVGLAELFGAETGDEIDKFAHCRWHVGPEGMPILDDCVRWCVGRVEARLPTGDHVAHLLRPVAAATGEWSGQLSFRQTKDIEPGHAP